MRVFVFALFAGLALTGAGCAAPNAEPSAAAQPKQATSVCSQERPLGSNIPVTKCRTAEQIEQDREAAINAVGTATRNGRTSSYQGNGN
jgi:hypothetical protein